MTRGFYIHRMKPCFPRRAIEGITPTVCPYVSASSIAHREKHGFPNRVKPPHGTPTGSHPVDGFMLCIILLLLYYSSKDLQILKSLFIIFFPEPF